MSDRFQPITLGQLTNWIADELEGSGRIFGIPQELFYRPQESDPWRQELYGNLLETPFGVAAGPHSQMTQNIVVAWLCGARVIELKTVQTLDELEIPKPCIDMEDEGYNCEWSQELKVLQSFEEYLRAWVVIHALHKRLGFPGDTPGVLFNMSVGYNYEGLQNPNMQEYLDLMEDAGEHLQRVVDGVAERFPEVRDLSISKRMCNSVTLSTMHGCPPGEIGDISDYLIRERGFHTSVKLNPTLLGPEKARGILNQTLGFEQVTIPDQAFEHDLKYPDALVLLRRLAATAQEKGVDFGVKLSNTLEVVNHRPVFPGKEEFMYMSGRPLHAMTVNMARLLSAEFGGELLMSFAGGADAFNVPHLLRSGMRTITTCSDILKSGGYLRLRQYLSNTQEAFEAAGASDLPGFVHHASTTADWLPEEVRREAEGLAEDASVAARGLANLERYAEAVLVQKETQKESFERDRSKTPRTLGLFDCIEAPCVDECSINQKVPQYMNLVREGRFDEAVHTTREDNPMATSLGRACDHICENRCVRTHYDEPLAIREIKRFITEWEKDPDGQHFAKEADTKVAVVGGGPCGLTAAHFLAKAGFQVTVFEWREYVGGMVSGTIPAYRTPQEIIDRDLSFLTSLGVEVRTGKRAGVDFVLSDLREEGFEHVVAAIGAQTGLTLGIPGEEGEGVWEGLSFLRSARHGEKPVVGKRIGVIGGGDVSMDCARTVLRLGAEEVTVIYRRTVPEMPAQKEEIEGLREEGMDIMTLVSPQEVLREDGKVVGLKGARMELGEADDSGRRRPVPTGEEITIPLDGIITAIGQKADLSLFGGQDVETTRKGYLAVDPETYETSVEKVYAGGDVALGGPESIVKAMGDGRRIAEGIIRKVRGVEVEGPLRAGTTREVDYVDLLERRSTRKYRVEVPHRDPEERIDFDEVVGTYPEEAAKAEAERCLDCHVMCSLCTSVCPNLAFMTYRSPGLDQQLPVYEIQGGAATSEDKLRFQVEQGFQVAVLTDFCNECGNCETFCPTSGTPYKDKPRLYLHQGEFEDQTDNAFRVSREGEVWTMEAKFDGAKHRLVWNGTLEYSSPRLVARLSPADLQVEEVSPGPEAQEGDRVSLDTCATMAHLLACVKESLPHLPSAQ